jgi:hypothetical protein
VAPLPPLARLHAAARPIERYVKLLPQPDERGPADRLNDDMARAAGRAGW